MAKKPVTRAKKSTPIKGTVNKTVVGPSYALNYSINPHRKKAK